MTMKSLSFPLLRRERRFTVPAKEMIRHQKATNIEHRTSADEHRDPPVSERSPRTGNSLYVVQEATGSNGEYI
jgi:hypothetical protein